MLDILKDNSIYVSDDLRNFICSLEEKYCIVSATEKYCNLVNFSQNSKVPFHQWFPYREGFSKKLILELLEMSGASKGECIIDPFCGSGTTNVVSVLSGYRTLGLDVNPMSAFISNAKVTEYSVDDINLAKEYLLILRHLPAMWMNTSMKILGSIIQIAISKIWYVLEHL